MLLATLSPLLTVADYCRVISVVCEMIVKVLLSVLSGALAQFHTDL